MSEAIYKILRDSEYRQAATTTAYAGSADDIRDRYIHFSTAAQLKRTLEKYFCGCSNIYILKFDAAIFAANALKWESSRGGALFPHLYGSLNIKTALKTWQISVPGTGEIDLSFIEET